MKNIRAMAPYNFIELPEKVVARYSDKNGLPVFSRFSTDADELTGYIEYEIENETELFIGDGKEEHKKGSGDMQAPSEETVKEFFRNADGQCVIPGSTVRGLVRSNAEILSFSYPEYIDESLFIYRGFPDKSKKLREEYSEIIRTPQGGKAKVPYGVKVGYIYKKGENNYAIVPAKVVYGRTFFRVDERKLRKMDLSGKYVKYMYKRDILFFKPKDDTDNIDRKKEWSDFLKKNALYSQPYRLPVTFNIELLNEDNPRVSDIKPNECGTGGFKGYLLNSGFINEKMSHYVVTEKDEEDYLSKEITLLTEQILAYEEDFKRTKKSNEFYMLPNEEGYRNAKPFFYRQDDKTGSILAFGATPYLRIYYKHIVTDGIHCEKNGIDYAKSVFGYTFDGTDHYKSRLSFINCILENEEKFSEQQVVVLNEPKPTSFQLYLNQNDKDVDNLNNYNDMDFKLRGYKFYWLKNAIGPEGSTQKKVNTVFRPLLPGRVFKGRIYFENLKEDELGLILMALKPFDKAKENIGTAKSYGFGKVEFKNIGLFIEDMSKKFASFTGDYHISQDPEEFKAKFKAWMSKGDVLGNRLDSFERIKQYFASKLYVIDNDEGRYMRLEEFKKRERLGTVKEITNNYEILMEENYIEEQLEMSMLLEKWRPKR